MPSKYPQNFLSSVLAAGGEFTLPPETAESAGSGKFSQELGFPPETSQPLSAGGFPPDRLDFNGVLNLLSQFVVWYQQGGLLNYSTQFDYEPGNEVLQNGVKYRCLEANGPGSSLVTPGTSATVWKNVDANVPVGAIVPFYNVTLGGSDGRRPIFWGRQAADEGWVLCDGGTDGQGGTVPDLTGKFIKGSNPENAGQTGGSETQTLTADQLPAHTHTITIQSNGSHSHTRGTMDISGSFGVDDRVYWATKTGAFYADGARLNCGSEGTENGYVMNFQASRSWTGSTSSNGSHSHNATCASAGNSSASISTQPPFYQLAFFVKLPEA